MKGKQVRILRVLEYIGPYEVVQTTLEANAVKGVRHFGDLTINDAIVGQRPDLAPPGYYDEPNQGEPMKIETTIKAPKGN